MISKGVDVVYRLAELAALVDGELVGPGELEIAGIAPLEEAGPDDISMAVDDHYLKLVPSSQAGALVVGKDVTGIDRPHIRVAKPRLAFITLLRAFTPDATREPNIHPTAILGEGVTLGVGVYIGPYVTIGDRSHIGAHVTLEAGVRIGRDVQVGEGTVIHPNVVIYDRTRIGSNVIIHGNAVVGSDGYGFVTDQTGHHKVPHIGRVEIGDDVEIGACVTIDRATCGTTRIGRGTKIGNLSQVAHNVQIGEDCLLVGMVGVAGSCRIGNRVTVAGQAGLVGHIEVGDGVTIAGQSMVAKSVPAGTFVSGAPARPHKETLRTQASIARVPGLLRDVKAIKARLAELEKDD